MDFSRGKIPGRSCFGRSRDSGFGFAETISVASKHNGQLKANLNKMRRENASQRNHEKIQSAQIAFWQRRKDRAQQAAGEGDPTLLFAQGKPHRTTTEDEKKKSVEKTNRNET